VLVKNLATGYDTVHLWLYDVSSGPVSDQWPRYFVITRALAITLCGCTHS